MQWKINHYSNLFIFTPFFGLSEQTGQWPTIQLSHIRCVRLILHITYTHTHTTLPANDNNGNLFFFVTNSLLDIVVNIFFSTNSSERKCWLLKEKEKKKEMWKSWINFFWCIKWICEWKCSRLIKIKMVGPEKLSGCRFPRIQM